MYNSIRLETKHLILTPVKESDCNETYLGWLKDPIVNEWLEQRDESYSVNDLIEFVKSKKNEIFLAIRMGGSGKHIGNIKIDQINPETGTAEYGILIGDVTEWGKGYAKEASEVLIQYCFSQTKIGKIQLGYVVGNDVAAHLYRKLGFAEIGRIEGKYLRDDKFYDIIRMEIAKSS